MKLWILAAYFLLLPEASHSHCNLKRTKFMCESPGSPCVWGNNHCSLRRLMPEGDDDENPSVLKNFGWKALNEHKWPGD
jgi:hypothetical protein